MSDEFSNFKSAIEWPSLESEEQPTAEMKPFRQILLPAIEAAAESFVVAGHTESPIETFFGARFSLAARKLCAAHGWTYGFGDALGDIRLTPQFKLGRFRYDFAIWAGSCDRPVILIECDGADFHSSEEQQSNDLAKDSAATAAGFRLLRFTGSQLFRDADACVFTALKEMAKALE